MEKDFWLDRWNKGEIGFHQSQFHPSLVKYAHMFSKGTILVPLCGKTLDMIFLASLGHQVIGVELSELACRDFFQENKINFTERKTADFTVFESGLITLWCGDFFKLPMSEWNKITGIFDRASLIALPPQMRKQYAEVVKQKTQLEMLLISFEYPEGAIQGPPFSVTEQEIQNLYPNFLERLETIIEDNSTKGNPRFRDIETREVIYWAKKR